jgi:hypothetical protein
VFAAPLAVTTIGPEPAAIRSPAYMGLDYPGSIANGTTVSLPASGMSFVVPALSGPADRSVALWTGRGEKYQQAQSLREGVILTRTAKGTSVKAWYDTVGFSIAYPPEPYSWDLAKAHVFNHPLSVGDTVTATITNKGGGIWAFSFTDKNPKNAKASWAQSVNVTANPAGIDADIALETTTPVSDRPTMGAVTVHSVPSTGPNAFRLGGDNLSSDWGGVKRPSLTLNTPYTLTVKLP